MFTDILDFNYFHFNKIQIIPNILEILLNTFQVALYSYAISCSQKN